MKAKTCHRILYLILYVVQNLIWANDAAIQTCNLTMEVCLSSIHIRIVLKAYRSKGGDTCESICLGHPTTVEREAALLCNPMLVSRSQGSFGVSCEQEKEEAL